MTEESGRPSTRRSKVGCDAIDEPCTKRMVPTVVFGSPAHFSNMNSFTLPSLLVQCSSPRMAAARDTSFIVHLFEVVALAIPAERELCRERDVWRLSRQRSMRSGRMRRAAGIADRVEGRYAPH